MLAKKVFKSKRKLFVLYIPSSWLKYEGPVFWIAPKWVKSNRRRRKREKAKVSNGQETIWSNICCCQWMLWAYQAQTRSCVYFFLLKNSYECHKCYSERKKKKIAGYASVRHHGFILFPPDHILTTTIVSWGQIQIWSITVSFNFNILSMYK